MISDTSFKKILNNALIVLSGNMGANLLSLISLSIFTRSVGTSGFGYYVLFLTFIGIIDSLFNFKTWQAFIKFATDFHVRHEEHRVAMLLKYSFFVDVFSLLIAFIVAYGTSGYIADFFSIPLEYQPYALLMTFLILFNMAGIATGVFRFFDEFTIQSKIAVYTALMKLIIFLIIAWFDPKFANFIYATLLIGFITLIVTIYFALKVLHRNGMQFIDIVREPLDFVLIKELKILSFIIYNNFDVTVRMVSRQLDVVLVGKLYSAEAVGIYKIAKEVANIIAKFTDPVYQAIYPELAKLLAKGHLQETRKIAVKISLYAGIAGILFYVCFLLFGRLAIEIAFGQDFSDAYRVTAVYFIAIFLAIITLPLYPIQHAFGYAKQAFTNQLYATLLYLPVLGYLTFEFGIIGASIAYIVYYIYLTFLTLRSVKRGFQHG